MIKLNSIFHPLGETKFQSKFPYINLLKVKNLASVFLLYLVVNNGYILFNCVEEVEERC